MLISTCHLITIINSFLNLQSNLRSSESSKYLYVLLDVYQKRESVKFLKQFLIKTLKYISFWATINSFCVICGSRQPIYLTRLINSIKNARQHEINAVIKLSGFYSACQPFYTILKDVLNAYKT